MSLIGDVDKTAAALDLDPSLVGKLVDEFGWDEKVRRVCIMSKSTKPGDWERAQNRALNFVQAHRLRTILDKLIGHYSAMTAEQLSKEFQVLDKNLLAHPSARYLADLAAACEKVQALSYAALGDTVKERVDRLEGEDGGLSPDQLHAAVIAALNAGGAVEPKALIAEPPDPATFADPERTRPETDRAVVGRERVES